VKKFIRINFIMTFILILCFDLLPAQENTVFNGSRHKIGFITGYGGKNVGQLINIGDNDNYYDYKVWLFQLQYYYTAWIKKKFSLELLFQPQYNITKFKNDYNLSEETTIGYEIGINIGLLARINTYDDFFSFYFFVSSGPQWNPVMPERQSSGFIFSNNIFFGMNIRIIKNLYFDIRPGFRHLSNLSLNLPNHGINNLVLSGGVFYVFRPEKK